MSESMMHPTTERLQALVERGLDEAERAVVESHVQSCPRCLGEVEEWRSLFASLERLPELAPAPGFANRVMARVTVRRPATEAVLEWLQGLEWLRRVVPQTTQGWAAAAALLALPLIALGGVAYWLTSQPGVTGQTLLTFLLSEGTQAATLTGEWLWARLAESTLGARVADAYAFVIQRDMEQIGLAAAGFATLTAVSVWILYQNLYRGEPRETPYVSSFVF